MATRSFSAVGGGTGGAAAYGKVPQLPTTQALQSNLTNILGQAIPNFSGMSQQASGIIGSALSGQLPPDVQNLIQDRAATMAVSGGMPGSSNTQGTLFGNRGLRDLGLTSLQRQDSGVKDLIGFLGGVSGAAAPTFAQAQDQENAIAKYASAPDPSAAAAEQARLYDKYSNPAAGTVGGSQPNLPPGWTLSDFRKGFKNISGNSPFGIGGI